MSNPVMLDHTYLIDPPLNLDDYDRQSYRNLVSGQDFPSQIPSPDKANVKYTTPTTRRFPVGFRLDCTHPDDPWLNGTFLYRAPYYNVLDGYNPTYLCVGRIGHFPYPYPDTMHLYSSLFRINSTGLGFDQPNPQLYPNIANQWVVNYNSTNTPVEDYDWMIVLRAVATEYNPIMLKLKAQLDDHKDIAVFYEKQISTLWASYVAYKQDENEEIDDGLLQRYFRSLAIPASQLPMPLYYNLLTLGISLGGIYTQLIQYPYSNPPKRSIVRDPVNVQIPAVFNLKTPRTIQQEEINSYGVAGPMYSFPGSDDSILYHACPLYRKDEDNDAWTQSGMLSPVLR